MCVSVWVWECVSISACICVGASAYICASHMYACVCVSVFGAAKQRQRRECWLRSHSARGHKNKPRVCALARSPSTATATTPHAADRARACLPVYFV